MEERTAFGPHPRAKETTMPERNPDSVNLPPGMTWHPGCPYGDNAMGCAWHQGYDYATTERNETTEQRLQAAGVAAAQEIHRRLETPKGVTLPEPAAGPTTLRTISAKSWHHETPMGDDKVRHDFAMNGVQGTFVAPNDVELYLRPLMDGHVRGCELVDGNIGDVKIVAQFWVAEWIWG